MRNAIKKYRILLLLEIVCIILTLPGCFAKEKIVASQTELQIGAELNITQILGESIQLKPGVYQVRVHADIPEGNSLYVNVASQQNSFRALRSNGAYMFANQEYLDFEVYVLETIDNAYLTCDFVGDTQAFIDSMEIYRINWGARILLTVLLMAFLVIDFLVLFREGILNGTIKKEQQLVVWMLLGGVLIAYFPYLTDYFTMGADTSFHLLRIEGLKESLLQGERFPVKVQSYWLYGHGYAVSAFYGDLFLYLPVLMRLIGFSITASYKFFVFATMVATAVIAYYSFKRCTKHTYAALFGSFFYMLAPYRIYNFYNRGAVGEYLAMTFMPLVICGMYELYTKDVEAKEYSKAKVPLIVGLSCILQSHLLSCEMTVVFMLAICLIFWKKTFRKKTFLELGKAAVICLLVNCWFWYPLFHMMSQDTYLLNDLVNNGIQYMGTWFAEIFQVFANKGTAQSGMYMAEPFQIGIATLLMLCVAVIVLVRRLVLKKDKEYENPYDKSVLFWAVMTISAIFLSTRYFPWDLLANIPGVKFLVTALQFPTRLFSPASVLGAMFAVFFVLWLEKECTARFVEIKIRDFVNKGAVLMLLILAVGSSLYHVNDIAYEMLPTWLYTAENMGTVSVINGEYLFEGTQAGDYSYHDPVATEGLEWSKYVKVGNSMELEVANTTGQEAYLEVPVIGYQGYVVKGEETTEELPYITEERGAHGDLRVAIPKGYCGTLSISYQGAFSYRIAEAISLISLIAILGILVFMRKGRRSQ